MSAVKIVSPAMMADCSTRRLREGMLALCMILQPIDSSVCVSLTRDVVLTLYKCMCMCVALEMC